jgi:DNA repair protein RadD
MTITLRDYQQVSYDEITAYWAMGAKNVLYVAPCRSGKTVVMAKAINDNTGASIAIAHRSELLQQMSMTLAKLGIFHKIIGPAALSKACAQEHVAELGRSFISPQARCYVASAQTLAKCEHAPWMNEITLWITDECFPAGTMVSGKPIETIQVGDIIEAFNEVTGEIELKPVVRLFKTPAPEIMVSICISGHHVVNCTSGHPFYTQHGWKNAADLTINDMVLQYEVQSDVYGVWCSDDGIERTSAISISKDRPDFLLDKMRDDISGSAPKTEKEGADPRDPMLDMRETCGFQGKLPHTNIQNRRPSVLFDGMSQRVQIAPIIRNDVPNESEICFGKDDVKQPDSFCGNTPENKQHAEIDQTQTRQSRREWQARDCSGRDFIHDAGTIGICDATSDQDQNATRVGLSDLLQTRFGTLGDENSDRSGRCKSSRETAHRREERYILKWVRLDSVEIYQRANIDAADGRICDGYVYNIEVADLHTYIANGIVVHNCHHYYRENSWTKSLEHFVNSRGLGVTATPIGAGGKGLGKHADGLMEAMVLGIESRELIRRGFLTDYKIVAPESDIDLSQIAVSSSGEYSPKPLADAVHKSKTIVGDVVSTYLKFTPGKLGMTFCVDIEAATEMALAFRKAGVPAEALSGKTIPSIRRHVQQQHKQKKILQICSVDLYGEGIDVPDLEVVSFARPTNSLGLYIQQFWRPGNPRHDKPRFWVLDHVGNVRRHLLPDAPRTWTLDRREKRSSSGPKDDVIPLRTCLNPECLTVYERIYPQCPECGHIPPIAARGTPEAVDGELLEMSPELLARLRGEIDKPLVVPYGAEPAVVGAVKKHHRERAEAQVSLRESMAMWGGCWNEPDGIKQRRFFHTFGCDVMTAMGLNKADALILQDKVDNAVSKR